MGEPVVNFVYPLFRTPILKRDRKARLDTTLTVPRGERGERSRDDGDTPDREADGQSAHSTSAAAATVQLPSTNGEPSHTMTGAIPGTENSVMRTCDTV